MNRDSNAAKNVWLAARCSLEKLDRRGFLTKLPDPSAPIPPSTLSSPLSSTVAAPVVAAAQLLVLLLILPLYLLLLLLLLLLFLFPLSSDPYLLHHLLFHPYIVYY